MVIRNKIKTLNLYHQQGRIRQIFPEIQNENDRTNSTIVKDNVLTSDLYIRSTSESKEYKVRIIYALGSYPKVWLYELKDIELQDIPHTYSINKKKNRVELCLFYPRKNEWKSSDLIADTIIPWISEWLFYYEIWLITGTWEGGGVH